MPRNLRYSRALAALFMVLTPVITTTACHGASSGSVSTSPTAQANNDLKTMADYTAAYKVLYTSDITHGDKLTVAAVRSDCKLLSKALSDGVPYTHSPDYWLRYWGPFLYSDITGLASAAGCTPFKRPQSPERDDVLHSELKEAGDILHNIAGRLDQLPKQFV